MIQIEQITLNAPTITKTIVLKRPPPPVTNTDVTIVVMDDPAYTGGPLGGASVKLNGVTKVTGVDGKVTFLGVPYGTYSVEISIDEPAPPVNTDPIGGGPGYSKIIASDDPRIKYTVGTPIQLITALAAAMSGDIVYVRDDAEINLTQEENIIIPRGVTLASGRGRNGSLGGLLYDTFDDASGNYSEKILFIPQAGSRITGLRFRGANPEIGATMTSHTLSDCFRPASPDVEFDNNEIYLFRRVGIGLYELNLIGPEWTKIHHNKIWGIFGAGMGYGVDVACNYNTKSGSRALIESNIFDWCRHFVAGDGEDTEYIFRDNVCTANGTNHGVDMHGTGPDGYGGVAGKKIEIYGNTFGRIFGASTYGPGDGVGDYHQAVNIRGVPSIGAYIHDNILAYPAIPMGDAIVQMTLGAPMGNFFVTNNTFNGVVVQSVLRKMM